MSHFTVLVIGDDVEAQLAPFHEFECTGRDDQYVQDIDVTEETRKDYAKHVTHKVRAPDGTVYEAYDDIFYRKPTEEERKAIGIMAGSGSCSGPGGLGTISYSSREWADTGAYETRVYHVPVEWTEFEEPTSKSKSFAEFAEYWHGRKAVTSIEELDLAKTHKYGYVLLGADGDVVKIVDRTNPNKKWDGFAIGGRWTGYFKLKEGAKGAVGKPGLMTDPAKPGYADSARKGDIDMEGMRAEAEAKEAAFFDDFADLFADHKGPLPSWDEVCARVDAEAKAEGKDPSHDLWPAKRSAYRSIPLVQAIEQRAKEKDHDTFYMTDPRDRFCDGDRSAALSRARSKAISTFALLYEGKWYEKGEMGFWCFVANEKNPKDWLAEFNALLDSVSDDTLLTLVDCHI